MNLIRGHGTADDDPGATLADRYRVRHDRSHHALGDGNLPGPQPLDGSALDARDVDLEISEGTMNDIRHSHVIEAAAGVAVVGFAHQVTLDRGFSSRNPRSVRTADFDYHLPPDLVAQDPVEPRDAARLMVLHRGTGSIEHRHFRDLPDLLDAGDLLVVNDTRVMAARLRGSRPDTGGSVEALLVRELGGNHWEVMFRPARRAVPGRRFEFELEGAPVAATVVGRAGDLVVLEFDRAVDPATAGSVPLPPYITGYRGDPGRYQTIYARDARSAAAPTAGLHFTPALFQRLGERRVERTELTLEVGPGTFRPVTVEDPHEHRMHGERFRLGEPAAEAIRGATARGNRVVAVGTTVVRTLEHIARERGSVEACEGETSLFILPGDTFRVVTAMVTNFHLPRSTLLMLVAAFAGTDFVLEAYRRAVAERYRFFSFGDAMLIL